MGELRGIVIRAARSDEAEAVVELWRTAAAGRSTTDHPDAVRLLIERDPAALQVAASADGAIVGTLITGFDGWRGAHYRLAAFRSCGAAVSPLPWW